MNAGGLNRPGRGLTVRGGCSEPGGTKDMNGQTDEGCRKGAVR